MVAFRLLVLACVVGSMLQGQVARCAEDSTTLYVISSSHVINTRDFTLNRLEGGRVANREALGGQVGYGYSRNRLAIFSFVERGYRLKSWELPSGKKLSDVGTSLKLGYMRFKYGASQSCFVDDQSGQVLSVYPDLDKRTGRQFKSFEVCDLASGKSYVMPPDGPALAGKAQWLRIKHDMAIKYLNGDIGIYDPQSYAVGNTVAVKGIAKKWDDYFPKVGLVRRTTAGIEQLSGPDFRPLPQPKPLKIAFAGPVIASGIAEAKGHPILWVVTKSGEGECETVLHDLLTDTDTVRRRSQIAATAAFANSDGTRFILADTKQAKRAIMIDPKRDGTLCTWSFSWAEDASVIPAFEK